MYTLAHFSDPHLGPLPTPALRDLLGQRLLGFLSWHRRRKFIHGPDILAALSRDIQAQSPDHIAITGDLTNISLLDEFSRAADWLAEIGPPDAVSVVPGNHDAYVALPWAQSLGLWQAYFSSDGADISEGCQAGVSPFPFVRRRGRVALIGVNTAVPTLPTFASGRVGGVQLDALGRRLDELGAQGMFRVVLLHHPPQPGGASWRKHLSDAPAFRACIARSGAEMILHGHNHKFVRTAIPGPGQPVGVFGVPSASARIDGHKPRSHYNLYRIGENGDGWQVELETRGLAADRAGYDVVETDSLTISG